MPAYLLSGKTYCSGCYWELRAQGKVTNTSTEPTPIVQTEETNTQKFDTQIANLVNRERAAVYGHPLDDFERLATLRNAIADCKDPALRVTLEQICCKISRLVHSPDHFDSWLDIAGYARCAVMILDKRNEKK